MSIETILVAIRSGYALCLHNDCTTVCRVSPTVLGGCVILCTHIHSRVVYSGVKSDSNNNLLRRKRFDLSFSVLPLSHFPSFQAPSRSSSSQPICRELVAFLKRSSQARISSQKASRRTRPMDMSRNIGQNHGRLVSCSRLIHSGRSTWARE